MKSNNIVVFGGWAGFIVAVVLFGFILWDHVTMRLESHEQRIRELEAQARPLVVVDKWAHVYLNGEEVPPPQGEGQTEKGE